MKGFTLGAKFNLNLLAVFVAGTAGSWFITSWIMGAATEREVSASANMLLKTAAGVRSYTNENVKNRLAKVQEQSRDFLPETVPAFAARSVFENFRKAGFEEFFYKEAAPNPTNVKDDKADTFEEGLIQAFRSDPQLTSLSGYREDYGGVKRFYTAQPLWLRDKDASCLACHSTPDAAPPQMIQSYGSKNGFDWKLNDVMATRVVYVPAGTVLAQGRRGALLMTGLFVLVFAVAVGVINLLLRRGVIRPLGHLALATRVISQPQNPDGDEQQFTVTEAGKALEKTKGRGDELGQLADGFVVMAEEVRKREAGLRHAQAQLQQREAYFRALIENASVAYVIVDSRYVIRYASPTVEGILGVDSQGLTGRQMLYLASADSQRALFGAVEQAERKQGTSAPFVFKRESPGGGSREVEAVVTNLLDQSSVKGLVIVLRDVRDHTPAAAKTETTPVQVQRVPVPTAEAGEPESPAALADRLIDSWPALGESERQAVLTRLVSAGLANGARAALPAAGAQAMRVKFQMPAGDAIDGGRVVELVQMLADFVSSIDTLVWSTWKTLCPDSDLRRSGSGAIGGPADGKRAPLPRTWGQYVAAEGTVPRGQVSYDLERTRSVAAALIASLGQVGHEFAKRYRAKFAPAEIEKWAAVHGAGGGLLGGKDGRNWRAYLQLAGEMDEAKIEAEVLKGLSDYAQSLMKSLR